MMSAERRQLISDRTRAAMASPEVRRKISERTREGMAARKEWSCDLAALRVVWRAACPDARRRFLDEIFEPVLDDHGGVN